MTSTRQLSVAEICEWFSYARETGVVSWKKKPARNIRPGDPAGYRWYASRRYTTYKRITVGGRRIFAHTVAFVLVTKRMPVDRVDHKDGNGENNRWDNLREVSHTGNLRNQSINRLNKSGVMGVDFHAAAKKWRARIIVDQKERHLGSFATKDEAIAARKSAERSFGFHENHGRAR